MNLKVLRDKIVVRPDKVAQELPSGLVMPDIVVADNPNYFTMTGTVVALGTGAVDEDGRRVPFGLEVGDKVCFNRYAGNQVTCDDDGIMYLVMAEPQVYALVDGPVRQVLPGYMDADDSGVKDLYGKTR